jgi:hypothetical protein
MNKMEPPPKFQQKEHDWKQEPGAERMEGHIGWTNDDKVGQVTDTIGAKENGRADLLRQPCRLQTERSD